MIAKKSFAVTNLIFSQHTTTSAKLNYNPICYRQRRQSLPKVNNPGHLLWRFSTDSQQWQNLRGNRMLRRASWPSRSVVQSTTQHNHVMTNKRVKGRMSLTYHGLDAKVLSELVKIKIFGKKKK
jgi:hypothetical protein